MENQTFDCIGVGAGSAGWVLASRLRASPKYKVHCQLNVRLRCVTQYSVLQTDLRLIVRCTRAQAVRNRSK